DADINSVDNLSAELNGETVMTSMIEVAKNKNANTSEKKKGTVTVTEGKGLYNILDLDNEITEIPEGKTAISRKFAEELGIQVGDTIYWHIYSENEWHETEVGLIYRSSETQGIACLREDFEAAGAEYVPSLLVTNQNAFDKENLDFVTAVHSKEDLKNAYLESMEVMNAMLVMMITFSVIMIVVVLYNSGSLSFGERVKEFATLKVLGLQSSQIRRLISVQNLWLSVIGVIIGTPLGNISLNAMMNSNGENFDYSLKVSGSNYIISGIIVLAVSVLVSFMFSKRIRRLDMVEVLKGVE
ncbi:MAG: ABC transporter permease, partial [Muribaculaceae bacterium]|nr:ABC transporter permease [Muribaculaceae bacterium]